MSSHATRTVHPWFQLILISLTSVILTGIFYLHLQLFETREPVPSLIPLTDAEVKERTAGAPPLVVGLYIRDFPEFDMIHGKFTVDLVVWFRCSLAAIPLEKLATFTFERAEIQHRSEPIKHNIVGKDEQIIEYNMRVQFSMPLNFKDFPVDDHRLNFVLSNPFLAPKHAVVQTTASSIAISPETYIEGWNIVGMKAEAGYVEHPVALKEKGKKFIDPRVVFSLDIERSGVRQIASIFLPLLIIFFITLLSFSVAPIGSDLYNVIAMSAASILALIAYRFVIETISPATSYFTLSDYMFIYFLLATAVILFVNALGTNITLRQKNIITVLLHVVTIVVFAYLLMAWS